MPQHIYPLKWKHFLSNKTSSLTDVFTENSFTDVTLVSDDQIPFQAHRFVLSAFSPVLKNILLNNPHSHPLIFLRGVNHEDLYSILQFIYLGKALVCHENMRRFAQAAKDLQIKKLAEGIIMGNPSKPVDDDNDDITNQDTHENSEDQAENEYAGRSYLSIADEIINLDILGSDELGSGKQLQYKCEECEASYKSKQNLYRQTGNKHEGIVYSYQYCGYKATRKSSLKTHKEIKHEGVTYCCNQCDFLAVTQSHLKQHKESVHEGVKYPCNHWDYQATIQSSLKQHKEALHEGVKYQCNQCDYQASYLKKHKESVHGSVKYQCNQCDYKATLQRNFQMHKKSAHEGENTNVTSVTIRQHNRAT